MHESMHSLTALGRKNLAPERGFSQTSDPWPLDGMPPVAVWPEGLTAR